MAPKRTIVIVVAIVVGVVAAVLVYYFLHNAQQDAYNGAKLSPAYVVSQQIPKGLSGNQAVSGGYFVKKDIPHDIRPTTAITDLSVLSGTEAVATYSQGQVLVPGMFLNPTQAAVSPSHLIPAGDVAVTITVDQVHGVAGLPVPGDKVNLLVTVNGSENFLLQNVPILAIGQTTTGQTTSTTTPSGSAGGLFTFAVRPSDAQRIAFAQQTGLGLYLTLVPPGNPVVTVPPTDNNNILTGPQASS
jgi:Flp pilus assembly protein CpaB